jgi:hypothetical protein
MRVACQELCWLLDRGYADKSALELVGNRHQLVSRQREALYRVCTPIQLIERSRSLRVTQAEELWIDGFNVLVTIEAALSGAPIFETRLGVMRDLASVHGSYRKIAETEQAIDLIHSVLPELGVQRVTWLLDRPVGNSGRLAALLRERLGSLQDSFASEVQVLDDVDGALRGGQGCVVASADRYVLDGAERWLDLAGLVTERKVPSSWRVELFAGPRSRPG